MGVRSAKAAGCRCIAVPNSFTEALDFSKADLVVKSLSEINSKLLAGL
jgi:beta-phosphoglucomutase-like phosphatase (HAD superfamily)